MAESTEEIGDELRTLDVKLKQLSFQYEQYFLGSRPREPGLLRSDVQKVVTRYSNVGIQNTALRFKFNNLCARFFSMRRHWDEVLRQIEEGTYHRHVFKANLHERERQARAEARAERQQAARDRAATGTASDSEDLFESYVSARKSCGEGTDDLSRERIERIVASQREAIRSRTGCDDVRFRVVVEAGRAKLKATPVKRQPASGDES